MIAKLTLGVAVAVMLLTPVVATADDPVCGNGMVEGGEACDGGVCCTGSCTFEPATTVCRSVVLDGGGQPSFCDEAERCTGSSATCPADLAAAAGRLCRPAAGACDVSEVCDGVSKFCPADVNKPMGTECRAITRICEGTTTPTPTPTGPTPTHTPTPFSTGPTVTATGPTPDPFANCLNSPCDEAETCDGVSPQCPPDAFKPSTTECRASAGPCDLADFCPGTNAFCGADHKSTALCRPSTGPCDLAESCNGIGNFCPPDVVAAEGEVCRPAAGDCDVAETCTAGGTCPADALKAAGIECRGAAGVCDLAENCTGSGPACPPDVFEPSTTVCRASIDAMCDFAENCTGTTAACPADAYKPDGTTCDDAMACTIEDQCVTGACVGNPMTCGDGNVQANCGEECDDGGTTSGDGCSATCLSEPGLGCPFAPLSGCRLPFVPAKASIKIRDQERIGGLKFFWKWRRGTATDLAELGDPLATTNYRLCIYDQHGLLTGSTAPAGGTCGVTNPKPCWKRRGGSGFKYKDVSQSIEPGGISKIILKAGRDGKAEVQLHATGGIFEFPSNGGLGLPDLAAIQQPLRIQVQNSTGLCFEAAFSAPPGRQDPNRFEDVAD